MFLAPATYKCIFVIYVWLIIREKYVDNWHTIVLFCVKYTFNF